MMGALKRHVVQTHAANLTDIDLRKHNRNEDRNSEREMMVNTSSKQLNFHVDPNQQTRQLNLRVPSVRGTTPVPHRPPCVPLSDT